MSFVRSLFSHRTLLILDCLFLFAFGIKNLMTISDTISSWNRAIGYQQIVLGVFAVVVMYQAVRNRQVPTLRGYCWGVVGLSLYLMASLWLSQSRGFNTIWDNPMIGGHSNESGMGHWIWLQFVLSAGFIVATPILMLLSSGREISAEPKLTIAPPVEPPTAKATVETSATPFAAVSPEPIKSEDPKPEAPKAETPKPREMPTHSEDELRALNPFYSTR